MAGRKVVHTTRIIRVKEESTVTFSRLSSKRTSSEFGPERKWETRKKRTSYMPTHTYAYTHTHTRGISGTSAAGAPRGVASWPVLFFSQRCVPTPRSPDPFLKVSPSPPSSLPTSFSPFPPPQAARTNYAETDKQHARERVNEDGTEGGERGRSRLTAAAHPSTIIYHRLHRLPRRRLPLSTYHEHDAMRRAIEFRDHTRDTRIRARIRREGKRG